MEQTYQEGKAQKTSTQHTKPVTCGKDHSGTEERKDEDTGHTLWDLLGTLRYSFLSFSPSHRLSTEKWPMQKLSVRSTCALVMFLGKKCIFSHLKGETREWMKRNKMDLQTRAGNQIITLTSNFGIRYFGYTILSLWFWLFNTKHPVLKGRLVVGLFIYLFFYLSFDKTVHHLPAQTWERERKKKR